MKTSTPSLIRFALPLACALLVLPAGRLSAVLVMEADFANGQNLTVGSPATGTLTGNATVSGGALQVDTNTASGVTYGGVTNYLNVSNASWGSNTIVTTFSLNSAGIARQTLMSTSQDNANGILLFANTDNATRGPRIDFYRAPSGNIAWMNNSKPLINTDYFLAVSWLDNEDGTLAVEMYLREISDLVGTSTNFQTFNITNPSGTNGMANSGSQTVSLGHRAPSSGYGSNGDPLNGDIYLFQTYNTFTSSQSQFNTLFNSVVIPEPGTATLLSAAGLVLLVSRRTRRKQA